MSEIESYRIPEIEKAGLKIQRVMLGTSPFIGAAQFGSRALYYYQNLFLKPENITKIIIKAFEKGVYTVQAIAHRVIIEALKAAEDWIGTKISVIGTIPADEEEEGLKLLSEINAKAALIHGSITDRLGLDELKEYLNKIEDTGLIAGIATHNSYSTLPRILDADLKIKMIMLSVNKKGYMMKDERFLFDLIANTDKIIIAKKVFAAGTIPPQEALSYIFSLKAVDCAALGIANEKEAEETFSICQKLIEGV